MQRLEIGDLPLGETLSEFIAVCDGSTPVPNATSRTLIGRYEMTLQYFQAPSDPFIVHVDHPA